MPVDGVHDLGGMQGFGPVEVEPDEPVFHADGSAGPPPHLRGLAGRHLNGRFRHAIERMDPAWYLTSPYYEHWLTAAATGLVEAGFLTQDELDARLGAPIRWPGRCGHRGCRSGAVLETHRFAVGDALRVREWHPLGHTRGPRYVQGTPVVSGSTACSRCPTSNPTATRTARTDLQHPLRCRRAVGRAGRPRPRRPVGELPGAP